MLFNFRKNFSQLPVNEQKILKHIFALHEDDYYPEAFQLLYDARASLDIDVYSSTLRRLYQVDTDGVPLTLLIDAFSYACPSDLMTEHEIQLLQALPEQLTIYRGSQNMESRSRISWSLSSSIASAYGIVTSKMIKRDDVYAYWCDNTNEEEIIYLKG